MRLGNLIYVVLVPRGSLVQPGTAGSLFLGTRLQVSASACQFQNSRSGRSNKRALRQTATSENGTVKHFQYKAGAKKPWGIPQTPRNRAVVLRANLQFTLGCELIIQITISTILHYPIEPLSMPHPFRSPHSETEYPCPSPGPSQSPSPLSLNP